MSESDHARVRRAPARPASKTRILAAAEAVFAERGFEGATTAAIARRAGLPKANLHYYFATKEELYRRVLGRVLDAWLERRGPSTRPSRPRSADPLHRGQDGPGAGAAAWRPGSSPGDHARRAGGQDFLETTLKSWIDAREAVCGAGSARAR